MSVDAKSQCERVYGLALSVPPPPCAQLHPLKTNLADSHAVHVINICMAEGGTDSTRAPPTLVGGLQVLTLPPFAMHLLMTCTVLVGASKRVSQHWLR